MGFVRSGIHRYDGLMDTIVDCFYNAEAGILLVILPCLKDVGAKIINPELQTDGVRPGISGTGLGVGVKVILADAGLH